MTNRYFQLDIFEFSGLVLRSTTNFVPVSSWVKIYSKNKIVSSRSSELKISAVLIDVDDFNQSHYNFTWLRRHRKMRFEFIIFYQNIGISKIFKSKFRRGSDLGYVSFQYNSSPLL